MDPRTVHDKNSAGNKVFLTDMLQFWRCKHQGIFEKYLHRMQRTYKLFSGILHASLGRQLRSRQSHDQMGFKPNLGVEDALVTLETICCKSLEWSFEVWFASLGLRKTFDRIEHAIFFQAVEANGVEKPYLDNLGMSMVVANLKFDFRSVKQSDVISLIFSMRVWICHAELPT